MDEIHNQNQADQPVKAETGPICIMDGFGVYPERLDVFVQEQCRHNWHLNYHDGVYECLKCGLQKSNRPT